MYTEQEILQFWQATRLHRESLDQFYLEILRKVLALPEKSRFKRAFSLSKSKGGLRRIVPADEGLKFIQKHVLVPWILKSVEIYDYSLKYSTGRGKKAGVLLAAQQHRLFTSAIKIDLASAFDQIDRESIIRRFRGILKEESSLNILADLVTYEGTTPQGCSTSPYIYNAVLGPVDLQLQEIKRRFPQIVEITRYVDDILISVNFNRRDILEGISKAAVKVLTAHGYTGRYQIYVYPPVKYLGISIYPKSIQLSDSAYDEVVRKVVVDARQGVPGKHRKSVVGCFNWVYRVYDGNVPAELVKMFEDYFKLEGTGSLPKKLSGLIDPRLL